MTSLASKWNIDELCQAMDNAISQCANNRYLRRSGTTIKFNGFWRDGDKQNVCAWLDKATWHDAKTGEGGGCKEFAKVAFNLSLPEFMERYAGFKPKIYKTTIPAHKPARLTTHDVHQIWQELCARDQERSDRASHWLEEERGIKTPRFLIGSGFANLYEEDIELFNHNHHSLIKSRLSLGPNLIAPLRGVSSDKVRNLFFRATHLVPKDQKSRLLTGMGGFGDADNELRGFGFPHLMHDFPSLVLCEGMADYFSAEYLLDDDKEHLPIGAANADSLTKWALWLTSSKYKGRVTIIFHLDTDKNDQISIKEIGPAKAVQAARILYEHKISTQIFPWHYFLTNITKAPHKIRDLADSLKYEECGIECLRQIFIKSITTKEIGNERSR